MATQWYLGTPEDKKGPYSDDMIRKGILEGKLSARLKVSREGSDAWVPLNEIPDFAGVLLPKLPLIVGSWAVPAQ
jgi:hypothetical protein